MRFKVAGNKRDIVAVVVKNAETAITIPQGAPVFLAANGTNDGLAVVSANNLAAALQGNFFGVALTDINPSAFGEACVFGFYTTVRIRQATRSASDAAWVSRPAGAIGDVLIPVTGTGTAASSLSADHAFSNAGSAAYSLNQQVRLMNTYASATTQASNLAGSTISGGSYSGISSDATAIYTTVNAFVKTM